MNTNSDTHTIRLDRVLRAKPERVYSPFLEAPLPNLPLMPSQLELFDTPPPAPLKFRLFVGIFPDPEAVASICNLQVESRDRFELKGKFRPREILHATLHHIDDYPAMPDRIIETAAEACTMAFAGQSSLEVTFDHLESFNGQPGKLPFVLVNHSDDQPLKKLHHRLITEMAKRRLANKKDFNFVPHVTMLYDRQRVPKQPVPPIGWKVNEVVLILSYLGETKYERLRSWALCE